ncbi:hypothetical protein NXS19_001553 [Fusarium pseudograminearum]|nr:hypothetical protein NXS19_001553 [Fusarium pseudograminearum]
MNLRHLEQLTKQHSSRSSPAYPGKRERWKMTRSTNQMDQLTQRAVSRHRLQCGAILATVERNHMVVVRGGIGVSYRETVGWSLVKRLSHQHSLCVFVCSEQPRANMPCMYVFG